MREFWQIEQRELFNTLVERSSSESPLALASAAWPGRAVAAWRICPPAWKWIDMMEQAGEIEAREARRWKKGIYGLMVLWGLEPDEVVGTQSE